MSISLRTVRAKLVALVAFPVVLICALMPVLNAVLHRNLMSAADDHAEDAERSLLVELTDTLVDLNLAVRIIASQLDIRRVLAQGDVEQTMEAANVFSQLYPGMDLLLAGPDGTVLAKVGPTEPPSKIWDISELQEPPTSAEVRYVLAGGCSKPSSRSMPSEAVVARVAGGGWIVACQPLNQAYLENASRKLGLELAILVGPSAGLRSATTHFPAEAVPVAGLSTSLLELPDRTWAVQRFDPGITQPKGGQVSVVAAVDVTNISHAVHANLYFVFMMLVLVAVASIALGSRIAGGMSRSLHGMIRAFGRLEQQEYVHVPVSNSGDELERLAAGFNHMVDGLAERDRLRTTFGKYMTESVLQHLLNGRIELGGKTLTVTILFSDIRSFTTISERLDAQVLVGLLNEYFTDMVSIVMQHHGVVDKYIGDAIMAVFGAPVPHADDAANAVRAAVQMRAALEKLNKRLGARGLPELNTGIGIHTGEVVAGNIGSEQRMEYTVIGDAVNLAARLESSTKDLNAPIIISQTTYKATHSLIRVRPMGEIMVKGRAQSVMTYELLGLAEACHEEPVGAQSEKEVQVLGAEHKMTPSSVM